MANSVQQSQPNLASLLELFKGNLMMQLNCHQVGEIVSFDPSTQTAEVQIKMMKTQNGELKDYAILLDCPCIVLSGGKGRLTFPITAGDSCLVLFNDRDIDNWFASGQKMQPRTERMHNYSDAIALVGPRNLQNKITDYFADGVELKHGNSSIKLKDGYIDIKGNVNIVQNTVDENSLHAYVISSYHSGTDWYRVWSDGWCEQGGFLSASSSGSKDFLKPYTQIVGLFFGCISSRAAASWDKEMCANSVTNTGFTYTSVTPNGGSGAYWKAEGYIS